jgi:hypothetical protein
MISAGDEAMLNIGKYTANYAAMAVLGVGLAVAAATPAKAQWFGWGGPYYGFARWPMAYGFAGVPRLAFGCGCPRVYGYAAYRRPYYGGYGYAMYRRPFYRAYGYAGYIPRYRFYRPAYAYAGYFPRYRFYRPAYAYAGFVPRFRYLRLARFVW